jgi:hypothetical protein
VFDKRNNFDQETPPAQRFMRKKAVRILWFVILFLIAAFQIMTFLRRRQQSLPFFHSTLEMVLVLVLVAVALLGVFVKSRQGRRN